MAAMVRSQKNSNCIFLRPFFIRLVCVLGIAIWPAFIPVSTAMQLAQAATSGSEVTIWGVVLSTADQKPVAGASVTLIVHFPNRTTTVTDDQGRFRFSGVPQDTPLNVSVKKAGYLCVGLRHTPWPNCNESVATKASDVQLTMTLMPQAVITGRVVTQAGEPIKNLSVVVLPQEIQDGRYVLNRVQGTTTRTDADGVFRVTGLEPGVYFMGTAATANVPLGRPPIGPGYQATWYPDSSTQDGAKPIVLAQGEQVRANLSVKESLTLINIPYTWNRLDEEGSAEYGLDADPGINSVRAFQDYRHHLFQVYAPYGRYGFQCCIYPPGIQNKPQIWSDGTTAPYCGAATFSVTAKTISVPIVALQQPVSIALRVDAELAKTDNRSGGAGRISAYDRCDVAFGLDGSTHFKNELFWNPAKANTELAFPSVLAGEHRLHARAYQGCYVASLTCGRINLLREPLIVGSDVPPCSIDAVLRDDFATISVTPSPQAVVKMNATGAREAFVFLIPLENTLQPAGGGEVVAGSNPSKMRVIPGKYLAFLYDGRSLAWREPDVQKHLMMLGKVFSVGPGGSQAVVLDWSRELNDPKNLHPRIGSLGGILEP